MAAGGREARAGLVDKEAEVRALQGELLGQGREAAEERERREEMEKQPAETRQELGRLGRSGRRDRGGDR